MIYKSSINSEFESNQIGDLTFQNSEINQMSAGRKMEIVYTNIE